jgi:2-dehydro-3-deoxygalactonokinase
MHTNKPVPVVGVDWGTTHRRAYALNSDGKCIAEMDDGDGALACKGRFPAALDAALSALNVHPQTVVMSGMVGSALGWLEVPYVTDSTALSELGRHLSVVQDAHGGVAYIVPGYCVRNAQGVPDVMRGEETQLLGAWAQGHVSGWFVLPGTHSKWVELDEGRVVQLRTYMTGELYDLLGQHGTLAAAAGSSAPVWDDAAFAEGVQQAGHRALSHQLFSCRARVVSKDMAASSARSYLSGLLIGTELKDVLQGPMAQATSGFKLIGSPQLAKLYQSAAQVLNTNFDILDAREAFFAAVTYLQSHLQKP